MNIVDQIEATQEISLSQLKQLLQGKEAAHLKERALAVKKKIYGRDIYIRGLIEFTSYCKNDCLYCGLRRSNQKASRYRLTEEEILACCAEGYALGFRTFVLQGGEDAFFTDEKICRLVSSIKKQHPSCAVTLSIGEKDPSSYEAYRQAGADRYLLRHETASMSHYKILHPPEMSLLRRMKCLHSLKNIGFQTGAGFIVGTKGQTTETIFEDLQFLRRLQPHMIGIGPFIPQHDTPLAKEPAGSSEQTLLLLSILRLLFPSALLPATTALATLMQDGQREGILAGANVIMPNLSPPSVRAKYAIYDKKRHTGTESAQSLNILKEKLEAIGCTIAVDIGDFKPYPDPQEAGFPAPSDTISSDKR